MNQPANNNQHLKQKQFKELNSFRQKCQYLHQHICTQFQPFRQYFLEQSCAKVKSSHPKYKPTLQKNYRDNMKIDRQIMYLKGFITQDFGEEIVEQYLSQSKYQNQGRRGNTSICCDGVVYWCDLGKLMCLNMNEVVKRQKMNFGDCWSIGMTKEREVIDVHEQIMEVKMLGDKFYLRVTREIVIVNKINYVIQQRVKTQGEIITFSIEQVNDVSKLTLISYQDDKSTICELFVGMKDVLKQCFSTPGLAHSFWKLTDNEVVMCKANSISVIDLRAKRIQYIYQNLKPSNNRIYAGLSLGNNYWSPQYLATIETFSAHIYDIRKCSSSFIKINHFCEESPPSVVQLYSGNNQIYNSTGSYFKKQFKSFFDDLDDPKKMDLLKNPLLIAHSPYEHGSSVFAQLSLNYTSQDEKITKQFKGELNKYSNKFQLLFDSGKVQQGYHPLSITPINLQNQIGFFHIDNYNGVSFQLFEKKEAYIAKGNKHFQPNFNRFYQRVDFIKQEGAESVSAPNEQWFLQQTLQKQLKRQQQNYWQKIIEQDDMDLSLQPNKVESRYLRYANLKNFYHQIYNKSKNINSKQLIFSQQREIIDSLNKKKEMLYCSTQNTQLFSQQERQSQNRFKKLYLDDDILKQLDASWDQL